MLAAEPPLTRIPDAVDGYPIHSLNQPSTSSSTCDGPADSSHVEA